MGEIRTAKEFFARWRAEHGLPALDDAAMLAALADFEAIAINAWLVQGRKDGRWATAYFAKPPSGTPHKLYPSKLDAIRAVINELCEAPDTGAGGKG